MKTNVSLALVCAALLAGCDFTVPLAPTSDTPIDNALVGAWERTTNNGARQRLLVLPLSKTEYLVSFPAGEKDAMFARATLCKTADLTLVQLAWFGTAQGVTPEDGRVYQYASYAVTGDTLKGRLLNAEVVDRDVSSTAASPHPSQPNRKAPNVYAPQGGYTRAKLPPPRIAARFQEPSG